MAYYYHEDTLIITSLKSDSNGISLFEKIREEHKNFNNILK